MTEQQAGKPMRWFRVRAALIGSPTSVVEVAIPDLQEELEARTHLSDPHVYWDSDNQRAIVEVEDEAPTPKSAAGGVNDDLLDSAVAVIARFDALRVEILEVMPAKRG
jgi:hypothetical protein